MKFEMMLNESDLELMTYYAEVIGVPLEELEGKNPQEQIDLLSTTMYQKLRKDAVGLKAKRAGLSARQEVINQYEGENNG